MDASTDAVADWHTRIGDVQAAWREQDQRAVARDQAVVAGWVGRLAAMRAEQAASTAAGRWTTGSSTLMGALWVQHNEVLLTRALAWVLRPEGRHRLGRAPLDVLAQHLRLEPLPSGAKVRVVTEDTRKDEDDLVGPTRADLVVYTPLWTMVIEAKVFAPEQPNQLDRLGHLWADDVAPCFVFLTRGYREPVTAERSAGLWRAVSWADLAALLRVALRDRQEPAGVRDFIETLEAYHRD
ncbi:PD-(D/E)XK nuclease family protein [Actinotalea solisilvae]|uniref:PD-(D/E)XK nuclease family protein n=1 Tax=Actinotalea solisilvae TaxID=2072922 RepID=UPI0018F19DC2|nr:PD-(D/E)XK nuclease family protein [Actinotalea solisilvae]